MSVSYTHLDVYKRQAISNSEGKYIRDVRIRTRMAVSAVAQDGALRETGSCSPGGSEGMEFYDTYKPEDIGKEAARIAMTMLYAQPCPSGCLLYTSSMSHSANNRLSYIGS